MTREDYRRGRRAVAVLAGRRDSRSYPAPTATRRSVPLSLRLGMLTAVGVLALAFVLSTTSQPSAQPSSPAAAPPRAADTSARDFTRVLAGDSGEQQLDLVGHWFADWDEARAAVDFTLKEPGWTPDGFWLSALQSFVPDVPGQELTPQSVVATFSGPDGSSAYYWIDQFVIARPDEFDIASTLPVAGPDIPHGVVQVAGLNALWSAAVMTLDGTGQQLGWDRSVTVLTWTDGDVGYRLEGKDVSLLDLVRIAESLR
jgi:hypothetical protein